jgi:hypothetical protein
MKHVYLNTGKNIKDFDKVAAANPNLFQHLIVEEKVVTEQVVPEIRQQHAH